MGVMCLWLVGIMGLCVRLESNVAISLEMANMIGFYSVPNWPERMFCMHIGCVHKTLQRRKLSIRKSIRATVPVQRRLIHTSTSLRT